MRSPEPLAGRGQRCAIYTRKSTEDGLEQEFNSLDAQREACAAYVLSQRHEGWTLVPDLFDDGGFSGGSMERPGLKRLLADIQAGKVDTIIVYKVDRLTRSLADFAKIVDVLDAAGASFVSITQSFNTTTSMGRLTLNVLLSFAQFEREVTGERIRDKIAASKKKGLWMGGPVPLGYDVKDRKLVVNEAEAQTLRHIMQHYLEAESVRALVAVLAREGLRTKVQIRTSTANRGGVPFGRGCLFHLLKNRIYLGEIVHKGTAYPGEHDAIVSQDLWEQVQAKRADNGPRLKRIANTRHASLLVGLVFDGLGRRMSPSHANKGSKRYRYYITHAEAGIDAANPAWRAPAHDIERIVTNRLQTFLSDGTAVHAAVADCVAETRDVEAILNAASDAALELCKPASPDRPAMLSRYIQRITLRDGSVEIAIRRASLLPDGKATAASAMNTANAMNADPILLEAETARVRRGHEVRLIIPSKASEKPIERDAQLVDLLVEAHAARSLLMASTDASIDQLAKRQGRCRTHFARLVKLSYLAPDIVTMVLEGRQPASLNRRKLMAAELPHRWADQRVMLGCN
jgi:DNA invertase Pin-like site-specific DNA recombinase